MAKQVTTLFIRETGINLLVMKGRQVVKWASSPLEPGLVSQGLILDEDLVAEKVKQLFSQHKVKTNKVITGLSGFDSLYRVVTLPELPEAVIPEAVKREAQRAIPTSLDEVYFSYQGLPGTTERRYFLATFPRNLTDALVRTMRKAGVKPYIMELAPLALCRIPDEPRAVIVNARSDHLDIMVMADRIPQVIRTLSLPGEAESPEERLSITAEELDRTITFYNSSHLENRLDSTVPVFVCGDLADAPETWESLVGASGHPVSPLASPVPAPDGFDPNPFMVNIGLALKELLSEKQGAHYSSVNFNALPEAYVPPSFSIFRVLVPVGAVVIVAAIIFLGVSVLNNRAQIEAARAEMRSAETSVTQARRDVTALEADLDKAQGIANALSNMASSIAEDRAEIHGDLHEIYGLAGDYITLGSVNHSGDRVSLSGSAPDVNAVYSYARELRRCGRFRSVWVNSITSEGTFSITLGK